MHHLAKLALAALALRELFRLNNRVDAAEQLAHTVDKDHRALWKDEHDSFLLNVPARLSALEGQADHTTRTLGAAIRTLAVVAQGPARLEQLEAQIQSLLSPAAAIDRNEER
jgi:hypothetical protein